MTQLEGSKILVRITIELTLRDDADGLMLIAPVFFLAPQVSLKFVQRKNTDL